MVWTQTIYRRDASRYAGRQAANVAPMPGRMTLTQDEMDRIADRLDIDDLLARYALAVDRGDWDLLDELFTPDATIDYTSAGGVKDRLGEVQAWLAETLAAFPARQHLLGQKVVTVDGDEAEVSAYFSDTLAATTGMTTPAGAGPIIGGGIYHHRLRRSADGWRSRELVEEQLWRVCL
jgi:hypothetical protein